MILVGETLFFSVEAATEIDGEHSRWKIKNFFRNERKRPISTLFWGYINFTYSLLDEKWGPEN